MVDIDYRLAPQYDPVERISLATASETVLRYRAFPGDIVIRTDECDLSTQWGTVPVLDFALALHDIVDHLADGDGDVFEFTESEATITFRRQGSDVTIGASYHDCAVNTSYVDLSAAASRLLERMLATLARDHPELRRNPFIASRFGWR